MAAAPPPSCDLSNIGLTPTTVTTTDHVQYTKWSGHIASWDALPWTSM